MPRTPDPLVQRFYSRLRVLAERLLGSGGHRLEPTEVVHECYLRLATMDRFEDRGDGPFLALASRTMRSVLVDLARRDQRAKRGSGWERVTLREAVSVTDEEEVDLLALDHALRALAELHPRQSRVVELRFFGGLEVEGVARVLGVNERTVARDWTMARAWLRARLQEAR